MTPKTSTTGICAKCPAEAPLDTMGLCRTCRLRFHSRTIYHWTPAMDDQLRHAYKSAVTRKHLTASLNRLGSEFRFPRYILTNRAGSLDILFTKTSHWTKEDIDFLHEHVGSMTVKRIAKALHRTDSSIKSYLYKNGIAGRLDEGYTQAGLAQFMGVSKIQVFKWLQRGLLDVHLDIGDRITHESVRDLVVYHAEEYSYRRVEEWWAKMLLREELGIRGLAPRHSSRSNRNSNGVETRAA